MSTRSMIGIKVGNMIVGVYCHYDGYLAHNGKILYENYKTLNKIEKLVALGSLSVLGKNIGRKKDFNKMYEEEYRKKYEDECLAYCRDRGEERHIEFDLPQNFAHEEYNYYFDNGEWYVAYCETWDTVEKKYNFVPLKKTLEEGGII